MKKTPHKSMSSFFLDKALKIGDNIVEMKKLMR